MSRIALTAPPQPKTDEMLIHNVLNAFVLQGAPAFAAAEEMKRRGDHICTEALRRWKEAHP